ncbi:serine/threonine protein kinase [Trypanosoma rangeli]|uniref:Serine/threonine protein kinase n=1 Tax=Trypanosoma rangeli TaxID=5698 RepID=A0A422P3R9_TRYRA|nr:serine/threonine protein kinase [Trypanosoma rangeli]RNF12358.1 serine/threonine protein kinase [Trypanosoma rangeli]|eukprot:RNF12358.1 serine/threonine protein kinase [Trypanosoma rangeli]
MCIVEEDSPTSLLVGREDGSIELYASSDAACFGKPLLTLYGHTKAVTAFFASFPEEVVTCSMDGTVRQWSTNREEEETKRCLKTSKVATPLRCLLVHDGTFYTGGDDGCLHVIEGSRRVSWAGHSGVLSCITVVSGDSQHLITGGYDNQIRVWDTRLGKTIRLLLGHQNHVKCLRVIGDGELLLSFGCDLTMKVWRLPEFDEENTEDAAPVAADTNRHATVSFTDPRESEGVMELSTSAGADGGEESGEVKDGALVGNEESNNIVDALVTDHYHAAVEATKAVRSAIKTRPDPPIRQLRPVGTIEIPEVPHVVAAVSNEAVYCYIGASEGYVFGINVRALSRSVLQFLSRNSAKVRADIRETRMTLQLSIRAIKKRCKRAVQGKKLELLRAARNTRAAKKAEERKERAAARAAARAARAAARVEEEEEDEEEENVDEMPDTEEEEVTEEEEEEEEEDPLALLDEAQREELTTFWGEQEKERDDEIESLRSAARERNKAVEKVGLATYDTSRDQFFCLSFTSYKKIGGEAVLGLVALPGGSCCAAQADRVKSVDTTPGITYL